MMLRRKMRMTRRERMVISPLVTDNSTCASSSAAEKEVDAASAVAEEARAAEVVATSRTRMAPKGGMMRVLPSLVNKEDLAVVIRMPLRSTRMATLTTKKVARASRIASIGASVVKIEAEVEEVTAEDPEGVAVVPVVEAIVKRPTVQPTTTRARKLRVIRAPRMRLIRESDSKRRAAAAEKVEVADAVVVEEPTPLKVMMKVLLELTVSRTSVVEVGAAVVVAIERTAEVVAAISKKVRVSLATAVTDLSAAAVVAVIVPSTVLRVKATSNSIKHTRASTIRTRNINKNLRWSRRVPLSPMLALPRDWRRLRLTRARRPRSLRSRALTASAL